MKDRLTGEAPYDIEYSVRRKDGGWRHWRARGTVLRDLRGKPYRWIGAVTDITDRKRVEERIAHLASFPELNPNPVLELDPAGEVLYANPAVTEALQRGGAVNDPRLFLPEGLHTFLPDILKGQAGMVEREVRVGDSIFLENISDTPKIGTVRIYARDITERKQAENALRESEEMFRNPVEHSSVGIYLIQDGLLRYANSRLCEMLGYNCDEILECPIEQFILPDDRSAMMNEFRKSLEGSGRGEHGEFRWVRKDGSVSWLENFGSGMVYHGRPAVYGTIIDITERKRMADQIAESLREKEVMLREIHHRVKNNLQIVNSLMNLQIQKVGDPKTIMALTDTQTRVRAMSLVHERLYKTQELSRIDLADYISSSPKSCPEISSSTPSAGRPCAGFRRLARVVHRRAGHRKSKTRRQVGLRIRQEVRFPPRGTQPGRGKGLFGRSVPGQVIGMTVGDQDSLHDQPAGPGLKSFHPFQNLFNLQAGINDPADVRLLEPDQIGVLAEGRVGESLDFEGAHVFTVMVWKPPVPPVGGKPPACFGFNNTPPAGPARPALAHRKSEPACREKK